MASITPLSGQDPPAPAAEPEPIFGVRCTECGHTTYFDKRRVCPAGGTLWRTGIERNGRPLDELSLKCEKCPEEFTAEVDCEGYK